MKQPSFIEYLNDNVSFISRQAGCLRNIYAPLCGIDAMGIKSAITPFLSGDIKVDKYHYLTKPASREDLRFPVREFFVRSLDKVVSLAGPGPAPIVKIGQVWHEVSRSYRHAGIELTAVNFVPSTGENVELMKVTVKNISKKKLNISPTVAVPLFARSLANKHDHEHVTALLHRIEQRPEGVCVTPTMAFNEEGHQHIEQVYYVFAQDSLGQRIEGSFPTVDSFYGDGGSLLNPQALTGNVKPAMLDDAQKQGKEAVGALRFKQIALTPGQAVDYLVVIGIDSTVTNAVKVFRRFNTVEKFKKALQQNQDFWERKAGSIEFNTGDSRFNAWMRWVTLQPVLRRIFGCSFLPDHDYGKGGKGWRDIWQDLLSLILIEPHMVRDILVNNCAGIRIDGSNATIIGAKPGEFLADRNAITRVWMDHGCWPLLTLGLYIQQTGDIDILLEKQTYFRDPQMSRTLDKDMSWSRADGQLLMDKKGKVYEGTILEHLLVQNLTQYFNVGEHNIIRLESADWNDGLDMAFAKGESVAFSSFYAGNLLHLANLIEEVARKKKTATITVAKELLILLDTLSTAINHDVVSQKQELLFKRYFKAVQPTISGIRIELKVKDISRDLRSKAQWLFKHIARQEKISAVIGNKKYQWFNGYYDNQAKRVEGASRKGVRMTLTGQVFAIMSTMATEDEIRAVIKSVDAFLKDKELGGYRLNTDFGVRHYLDLGRAFGFAYGTKENGAFFSHMIVMYAYALYVRGFAREGHDVLQSIYRMATDTAKSKIYPGIPEYFDSEGRGMYHYLTGSASWLVLTQLTQVFGVRGDMGDLLLAPQLVKEQFSSSKVVSVKCQFAGQLIQVRYHNPLGRDVHEYRINKVTINGRNLNVDMLTSHSVRIPRSLIKKNITIDVVLG